jgi:hypothetical protein
MYSILTHPLAYRHQRLAGAKIPHTGLLVRRSMWLHGHCQPLSQLLMSICIDMHAGTHARTRAAYDIPAHVHGAQFRTRMLRHRTPPAVVSSLSLASSRSRPEFPNPKP